MKSILLTALLMMSVMTQAAIKINRIDPTHWYVGMKDASLQLMVYGKDVRDMDVSTDYPHARIDSVVRLDSPDYLLLYLDLQGAAAGEMPLTFVHKGKKQVVKYLLKDREKAGHERQGFTNADVLYMLMPDRFASGSTGNDQIKGMNAYKNDRSQPSLRHGGDLEGIRQHLDYFKQLGVTALWFTPVLENNSPDTKGYSTYHGYATTDYYRVDPRFGTNDEYRRLVDEAHQRGLKIVMDMIFNHCGFEHPWTMNLPSNDWFNKPQWLKELKAGKGQVIDSRTAVGHNKTKSQYLQTSYKLTPVLDPYTSQVDLKETVDGWFVPTMPDLNQRNPHVLKYLIQNSIWWIEHVGIDGIRMDTYPYADRQAMAQWMKTIDNEYPNFNVVGETWVTEPAYTAAWQKDSKLSESNSYLKSVMDFAFFERINQAKNEDTDAWWAGFNRVYNGLVYDYLYPNPSFVMAFIENHDTDRFLGKGKDVAALKQAMALLLTMNRTPQLYYGTEILMNGTKEVTDGDVRKDFPGGFPGDARNAFTKEGRSQEENDMFDWTSRLLHWRQGNDAIIKGKQVQFIPYQGVYVLARVHNNKHVLTILNGTKQEAEFVVERYAEVIGHAKTARNILTGEVVDITKNVKLQPRDVLVLEF
ncbi:MAG: glycoside hydrolase family 13 protein [Prevotella sp.]|nr:glycoside hydrolase family 13 protein [Prevotella sp.]